MSSPLPNVPHPWWWRPKTMIHLLHRCNFTFKSVVVKLSRVPYVKNRSTSGIVSRGVSTTRVYRSHFFHWDYWSDHKVTFFFSLFFDQSFFSIKFASTLPLSQEVCHVSVVTIVLVSSCCKSEFHTSRDNSSVLTTLYDSCPLLEVQLILTFLTIASYEYYSILTEMIHISDPIQQ